MNTAQIDIVSPSIRLAFGLALLALGVFSMYRRTMLDCFRSELFEARDDLFDYMVGRGLPFDMPEYRMLRANINGLIRFAHQFHLTSILLAVLTIRSGLPGSGRSLALLEAMPPGPDRDFFLATYHRVSKKAFRYLMVGGTQSLVVVPVLKVHAVLSMRGRWEHELPQSFADELTMLGERNRRESRALRKAMAV